ncbi:MAG TPA: Hsp20/alpha crystallin family protein [Gaiellaceae bacterium]|jgi:HSP20 family protein|nr:Hsp20/alpha crystallin family protein [Gaiellaceae bacterium]
MTVIERWTPFRDFELMDQRMRRLFPALLPPVTPATDITETKDEIVFELEVPGYEEKELEVEVDDHMLTVAGHREVDKESTEKAIRLHERLESAFERSFQLPVEADSGHLKASYGKGVLTLRVPKTSRPKPLKVPIAKA